MKTNLKILLLTALLILTLAFAVSCGKAKKEQRPSFGDHYVNLIKSGETTKFKEFKNMQKQLNDIRKETGATYVYVISPSSDSKPALDMKETKDVKFVLTVDGSEDPDDWGTAYDWEPQFTRAWEGNISVAASAWNDDKAGKKQCWSAFAPIYDCKGKVVALLGIDYPATDVAQANPTWNRDNPDWNKMEDATKADPPNAIKDLMNKTMDVAKKSAEKLSCTKK